MARSKSGASQGSFEFEAPSAPHSNASQQVAASSAPRLTSADPSTWGSAGQWSPLLEAFWASVQGEKLLAHLADRLQAGAVIYPPRPLRALELTQPAHVKVVILGQDPYHGPGQAEGLAFSVAPGVRVPPSLRNIYKELHRDLGVTVPQEGSLVRWAQEGVLLLNTSLTVEDGAPASHAKRGWETLTDSIIRAVSDGAHPVVFMLWGAHAQAKRTLIDESRHRVLTSNHPSPLSALRPPEPFMGCGHFGAAVRWLAERNVSLKF